MKRILCLLMVAVLLCGLCACGGEKEDNEVSYASAQEAMAAGDYYAAYTMLKADGSEEALKELEKFEFILVGSFTASGARTAYTYDERGFLVDKKLLKANGDSYWWTYTYDVNGNLTQDNSEWASGLRSSKAKYVYTYDKNGNELTCDYYKDGEWDSQTVSTYNANGQLTRRKTAEKDDYFNEETTYAYDKKGNLVKETSRHEYGVKDVYTYTYDDSGRVLTMETTSTWTAAYSGSGAGKSKEKETYTYTFDGNGRLVSKKKTKEWDSGKTSVEIDTYTYNEKGQLISECDRLGDKYTYFYNEDGNLEKIHRIDDRGEEDTTVYLWQVEYYPNGKHEKAPTDYMKECAGITVMPE